MKLILSMVMHVHHGISGAMSLQIAKLQLGILKKLNIGHQPMFTVVATTLLHTSSMSVSGASSSLTSAISHSESQSNVFSITVTLTPQTERRCLSLKATLSTHSMLSIRVMAQILSVLMNSLLVHITKMLHGVQRQLVAFIASLTAVIISYSIQKRKLTRKLILLSVTRPQRKLPKTSIVQVLIPL